VLVAGGVGLAIAGAGGMVRGASQPAPAPEEAPAPLSGHGVSQQDVV